MLDFVNNGILIHNNYFLNIINKIYYHDKSNDSFRKKFLKVLKKEFMNIKFIVKDKIIVSKKNIISKCINMNKNLIFTNDQKEGITKIIKFLSNKNMSTYGLYGYAGTGKTTLIVNLISFLLKKKYINSIVFTAPTNKAVNIMKSKFGNEINSLIDETKPTSGKHVSVFTPFFVPEVEKSWVLTAHRCREIGIVHPENYMVPSIISDHLKDVYSLRSIKEMDYVMNKYYFNIYNKYFRKFFDNTMNESSATFGGNEKFLNKMVNFMVDDTELVELDEQPYIRIKFPFINYSGRRLPHKWFEAVPRFPFIEGMVDNYDLTDDEAEYVLEKYSDKLRSKVFSIRKEISDNVND